MDVVKKIGLLVLGVGLFVFVFPFVTTSVNPDVTLGFQGLLVTLLGVLVVASNSFRKKVRLGGVGLWFAIGGWLLLSTGLLVAFAGFLFESQVTCSCPASGPCICGVPLYELMFSGGLLAVLSGAATIAVGAVLSRGRPVPARPFDENKTKIGRKGVTALAITLTVIIVFTLFSYWPEVYVTSIDEQTQFVSGIPPDFRGMMTSPTVQTGSGFQLPIGGTFVYVLHFNSVPPYMTYTINRVSTGEGFAIASTNASLPLVISPDNPSVSLLFSVRGPYYPYYGPVSFLVTIEK